MGYENTSGSPRDPRRIEVPFDVGARQTDRGLSDVDNEYASSRKRSIVIAAIVGGLVLAGGVGVALTFLMDDDGDDPDDTAAAYLEAWEEGDIAAMAELADDPPGSFTDTYEAFAADLQIEEAQFEVTDVERDGDDGIAEFEATLEVGSLGEWTYDGRLRMRRTGEDGTWLVDWSPAALHPDQQDGRQLTLVNEWPERGTISDMNGEPLVSAQPGTLVGINQQLMDDINDRSELHKAFEEHLDVDPDQVDAALDAPGVEPEHLVEVVTISEERFREVDSDLRPVPGIVFRERTQRMGPSEDFAAHVIGRTGEITAEQLEELGAPYQVGDIVGVSGLERRFERELAGTPLGDIRLVADDEDESSDESEEGEAEGDETEGESDDSEGEEDQDAVVHSFESVEPVDIPTTLNPDIQLAVDQALDGVNRPAAAVVVDREGNIQAISSRPLDEGFNRAIEGNYPPGSTFKVVTTNALLANGLVPTDEVQCSQTISTGGREFKNFEDSQLGAVPFSKAFAESCNTAFISATGDLPDADFVAAAERFGFNTAYTIGLTTAEPSFPEPADTAEHAAASIGQGRVLASPLHMATVAAAVNGGTWQAPTLLPDLEPSDDAPLPEPQDLGSEAATIGGLMELVVTEGSGDAAAVDGATVAGKTGTAEFGSGDPLPTHAWFIGFRGDLALAVLIEGQEEGGDALAGGRDAAPVAGEIFAALPQ